MDGSGTNMQQALFAEPWQESCQDSGLFDPCLVIRHFGELPQAVRNTPFSRVDRRTLDHELFTQLITQAPPPDSELGWSSRILKREETLFPYLGKVLVCVLIRLPGVEYTVEIDPVKQAIVHWEWQSALR